MKEKSEIDTKRNLKILCPPSSAQNAKDDAKET